MPATPTTTTEMHMSALYRTIRTVRALGGITPTVIDPRFKDVRVWDFHTEQFLNVGPVDHTGLYEMLNDNGNTVAWLFKNDVEILIEQSAELAGLDFG